MPPLGVIYAQETLGMSLRVRMYAHGPGVYTSWVAGITLLVRMSTRVGETREKRTPFPSQNKPPS